MSEISDDRLRVLANNEARGCRCGGPKPDYECRHNLAREALRLREEVARLRRERDEARHECKVLSGNAKRQHDRAEAAEARVSALEAALREAVDTIDAVRESIHAEQTGPLVADWPNRIDDIVRIIDDAALAAEREATARRCAEIAESQGWPRWLEVAEYIRAEFGIARELHTEEPSDEALRRMVEYSRTLPDEPDDKEPAPTECGTCGGTKQHPTDCDIEAQNYGVFMPEPCPDCAKEAAAQPPANDG